MKKTLLMMAAALTAWSASAQLYVTGGAVEGCPAAWDPANTLVVQEANGGYTFQATGEFKISTASGSWGEFDGAAYILVGNWNVNGETATGSLTKGNANIQPAKDGVVVTYTVKSDMSSISASFSGGEVEKFFQLHGDIFGDPKWSSEAMVKNGDNWEWTGEIKNTGNFGMKVCNAAGSQIDWIGGAATIAEAGKEYAFNAGDNSSCSLVGTYTVIYNPAANTIVFNGEGGDTPHPGNLDLFLAGTFNDWNAGEAAYKMTQSGNTYTITLPTLAAETQFKVTNADWTTSYGAEGDPSWTEAQPVAVTPNTAMNAWSGSGCNFLITEDLSNVTITFVKSDDASVASSLTVTADDTPIPPIPAADLFLAGTFNEWNAGEAAYKMTQSDNTYTITLPTLAAETQFKVTNADWTTSYGAEGDPSWTEAQPVTVTPNTAMNAWQGSGCNFLVAEALNNVTITFVKSDDATVASSLTVAGTSAIEAVEAAAAEATAEYYNLQGIRVLAPEAGQLYIVNRAGKISKEIAR